MSNPTIDQIKEIDLAHFIFALGIPNIELGQAKSIADKYKTWSKFAECASQPFYDFSEVNGIGRIASESILKWFKKNYQRIDLLAKQINFAENNKI